MTIRGVIFDLGSTLIVADHALNWPAAFARMRADLLAQLQAAGYDLEAGAFLAAFTERTQAFERQRLTDWVEFTTEWTITSTLAELGAPPPPPEVLARAVAAYYAFSESQWRPAPHLHAALQRLAEAGLRLGLMTNAPDAGHVQRLLAMAGLEGRLDPVVVSAAVGLRKPNPLLFERVAAGWGLTPGECVMVGDSLGADILGAQLAGLRNIWLSSQAAHPANQAHRHTIIPEAQAADLAGVLAVLEAWGALEAD